MPETKKNRPDHVPKITVLMCVYNGERFLCEAVESILTQTCQDFEFLIIDDGSTDSTRDIILSYTDPRIKFVENFQNIGHAKSLNKGVRLAQGSYIARMDADDISLPERLEQQAAFLDEHPSVGLVASHIRYIDIDNEDLGFWNDDIRHPDAKSIIAYLPINNCIPHPTVMIRSEILKRYKYREVFTANQEDWDLWMRLISDNVTIEKIPECLLHYRKHQESLTKKAPNLKRRRIGVQASYLAVQCFRLKFNRFNWRVFKQLLKKVDALYLNNALVQLYQGVRYCQRFLSGIPSVFHLKRAIKEANPDDRQKIRLLFMMPHMEVGGGEKVCLDILSNLDPAKYAISILTTRDKPHAWYDRFRVVTENIWHLPEKLTESQAQIVVSHVLERLRIQLIVINHSRTGYTLLPCIKKMFPQIACTDIIQGGLASALAQKESSDSMVDFIHRLKGQVKTTPDIAEFSAPYASLLNRRIAINEDVKARLIADYQIPSHSITIILNGIDTEYFDREKVSAGGFREKYGLQEHGRVVSFIGRLSVTKHPEFVVAVAKQLRERGQTDVTFFIAGDGSEAERVRQQIEDSGLDGTVIMTGYVDEPRTLLRDTDILFQCSEVEGLPLVILEAMAMSVPVVATRIGGIPELIDNGEHGFLLPFDENFLTASAESIIKLFSDPILYREMARKSRKRAESDFSIHHMVCQYDNLFHQLVRDSS